MGLAEAVEKVRAKLDSASAKFLVDKCDLIPAILVDDGAGNSRITEGAATATDVPCNYSILSSFDRVEAAAIASGLTHKLIMGFNDDARAITPQYKIKVIERPPNAEIIFEQPAFLRDSTAGLVEIAASVAVT